MECAGAVNMRPAGALASPHGGASVRPAASAGTALRAVPADAGMVVGSEQEDRQGEAVQVEEITNGDQAIEQQEDKSQDHAEQNSGDEGNQQSSPENHDDTNHSSRDN